MTTSFTTSDEFDPQDGGFGDSSEYPEAFGITFTPKITGTAIGVGGFLIAAYLFWSQALPVLNELSELNNQKQEKEAQLSQLSSTQLEQIIVNKRNELEETKDLKEDVMQLFSSPETIDTLLLDVNTFRNISNVRMNSYVPAGEIQAVTDDSLGTLATNNIGVKTFNLDLEGTFTQLQLFLQDLERLQPLLVVQNLTTSTVDPAQYLYENGQLLSVGEPKLKTAITLTAVFPDVPNTAPPTAEGTPPAEAPPAEGEQPAQ
ncbi:type II and III secretion system protein [Geminocystis sp. CENA526]|uniref:type II and III secretion system protein n=1 Tax=Geminocystis sp. CENA526 TaxID=1355871 RepID=UPI003D6FA2D0